MMKCALCGAEAPLRKSHIMPEFLHRSVYDEKHRTLTIGPELPTRVIQKGVRERLLCDTCEGRLQKFEDYFARLWYRDGCLPDLTNAPPYVTLSGLDYASLKLFVLSVIWRAAVSRRPEYKAMTLGPHGERIRRMLLAADPGPAHDYPIMGGLLIEPTTGEFWDNVLMAPMTIRVARHNAARTVFAGVSWTVLASSHPAPELKALRLQEDGAIMMPVTDWRSHTDVAGMIDVARGASVPELR